MSTFTVECEKCKVEISVEGDQLPDTASEECEIECEKCGSTLFVGWYAEIEVRRFKAYEGDPSVEDPHQEIIDQINQLSHFEMCRLWRNAPSGHIYFDKVLPYFEIFNKRLFKHFGGFTPEISKKLMRG